MRPCWKTGWVEPLYSDRVGADGGVSFDGDGLNDDDGWSVCRGDPTIAHGYEGDNDGECIDRVDNDRDGLFDCDDPGCVGSPDCTAAGAGEGEGEGEGEGVGTISGKFVLYIPEAGCGIGWDYSGTATSCSGCDYAFDVQFSVFDDQCGGAGEVSGVLEWGGGAAYFDSAYIGAVTASGGMISWSNYAYVVDIYASHGFYPYYYGYGIY